MTKKIRLPFLFLLFSFILISSCEKDDSFHSIKAIEREIHIKVNEFRSSEGLSTLVEQFLMFEEARNISNKLADGTYQLGDPKIQEVVNSFTSNVGGNDNGWITLSSNIENADSIVNAMLEVTEIQNIIKKDYSQSGVGVTEGDDGLFYVCHIFVNIPD